MHRTLSKLLIFSAIFLLTVLYALGQKSSASIKGRILGSDGKPAALVTVALKKHNRVTTTDNNGYFQLQRLPALDDTLEISSIDSKIFRRPISVARGITLDLGVISLQYRFNELENVEIRGRLSHSYKSDYSFLGTKTQTALKDVPQSVSSVTKELIQDKMEFTLKDAVTNASGVNTYSGYDEYTIRGFRAENARDIDGMRGYNTTYTSAMLVNVERVEIIKGPSATLYGNCDPGGTVNLVTKKPLTEKKFDIDVYRGSWDHFRAQADLTGPMNKNKTLAYRLNAGYDKTKSFRDQYYSNAYQVAPSFSFIPNDRLKVNLDFSFSHVQSVLDRGQPGFSNDSTLHSTPIKLMVTQPGDYLHESDLASILSLSYKINKNISFTSGWLNYNTWQYASEHGIQDYATHDSAYLYYTKWNYRTITNTITNYFTFRFNTGKLSHQLLVGYDYVASSVRLDQWKGELPDQFGTGSGIVGGFSLVNPQYFNRPVNTYQESDNDNDANEVDPTLYHTQGVYIQEQLSFNRWKLLVGLRKEFYKGDNDDSAGSSSEEVLLPRIGLTYTLSSNINLYATYNKGFDPFEASGGILQVFKDPFKPLNSELLEAGIKTDFFNNKLSASLAIYQLTVSNVAVSANDPANPDLFIQRGEDRAKGIEAEANGNITPELSIHLAYAYNDARILKSDQKEDIGKVKENAPLHSGNSWIKYSFSHGHLKGFGLALGHTQASLRTTLQDNLTLPGYCIVNAAFYYAHNHFRLGVNWNNVFNKTYWNSAYNNINKWPGAPANVMVNFGYSF